MSAFIVTHETVNAVVNGWTDPAGRPLPENQAHALGALLWDMNHEAFRLRYRGEYEPTEEYRFRRHAYTPAETLKAANCLRYQCAEGDVPETELYRQLEQLAERLDNAGLRNTKTYDDADWDLRNPAQPHATAPPAEDSAAAAPEPAEKLAPDPPTDDDDRNAPAPF